MAKPDYSRSGHSISNLVISQFCGLAPALGAKYGSGREAAVSRAYHANLAGEPGALQLFANLTPAEQNEVRQWGRPTDVRVAGVVLDYESAEKEVWVGLTAEGWSIDPTSGEGMAFLTVGRLDFGWVRTINGHRVAFVGDLKRSIYTSGAYPESLQLHAYGSAYAEMRDCEYYCTGIWAAMESQWIWSSHMVELGSGEHTQILDRIIVAASRKADRGEMGPHCPDCWARLHCPEYTLPVACADTILRPVAEGIVPDPEEAGKLLLFLEQIDDIKEAAKEQLKAWVSSGKLRPVAGTKEWRITRSNGRDSLDREAMAADGIDLSKYMRKGAPYDTMRKCNRKD